jgi:catalase
MALTFELSKVETSVIRERIVSHLLNIDETLANEVTIALGINAMPKPAATAVKTRQDLVPAPALSIGECGPKRFEGRKLGVLITDGADSTIFQALRAGIEKEKAVIEVIAPTVGGVTLSGGKPLSAQQMIDAALPCCTPRSLCWNRRRVQAIC